MFGILNHTNGAEGIQSANTDTFVSQRGEPEQALGGFQLLDLIIPELKSHVIPYKFKSSHCLKLQHSDWRANLVKDLFYK